MAGVQPKIKKVLNSRGAKAVVFLLGLAPLAWLAAIGPDGWGANPAEMFNRFLGDWTLRIILITLAITPLAKLFSLSALARFRRMIGLFAFFYAFLHLSSYIVFDQFFDFAEVWQDVLKRQYITVGMLTFFLLLPLAITSSNRMIKWLGGKKWKKLHFLVYPAAIGAVFHHVMMIKANYTEAMIHAVILAVLLGWRLSQNKSRHNTGPKAAPQASLSNS